MDGAGERPSANQIAWDHIAAATQSTWDHIVPANQSTWDQLRDQLIISQLDLEILIGVMQFLHSGLFQNVTCPCLCACVSCMCVCVCVWHMWDQLWDQLAITAWIN